MEAFLSSVQLKFLIRKLDLSSDDFLCYKFCLIFKTLPILFLYLFIGSLFVCFWFESWAPGRSAKDLTSWELRTGVSFIWFLSFISLPRGYRNGPINCTTPIWNLVVLLQTQHIIRHFYAFHDQGQERSFRATTRDKQNKTKNQ